MVSTPYTRGRGREYQALRSLRNEGWLCSRSAASHGPVDIFAGRRGEVLIIQVKSGKGRVKPEDKETLKMWAKAYGGRAEIWRFMKRGKVDKELVFDGSSITRMRPACRDPT
jgi:Holliday junction resolvase